jgi:hypothetical protein
MSRIVVTTLGTLGDLHPTIAIALESQHHGERQQPNRDRENPHESPLPHHPSSGSAMGGS